METKYFVMNDTKDERTLSGYGIVVPAKGRAEIPCDFARIFVRQFDVRKVTIEGGKEIDNTSYKEFLENSKKIKEDEKSEEKKEVKKNKK